MIFTKSPYRKKYILTHPWVWISDKWLDIKNAWQRANKGYCERDLFDIDHWFTKIFPQMLLEFNQTRHGYPSNLTDEEWGKILEDMAHYFMEANADTCSEKNEINYDFHFEFEDDINKDGKKTGFKKLNVIYPTKEDEEKSELSYQREIEVQRYQQECLKKGLDLFNQYIVSLWD